MHWLKDIYDFFFIFDINTYMKDQHPHELSFCFAVPMTNLLYSFKKNCGGGRCGFA